LTFGSLDSAGAGAGLATFSASTAGGGAEALRSTGVAIGGRLTRGSSRAGADEAGEEVMAAGPAALALASGTALHPVSIRYERLERPSWKHRTVITFHDRVEVPATGTTRAKAVAMTQQCANALGAAIVEHTADWHMLQRVFLDDLTPRPSPSARADHATGTWP
jgi:hypothetical protein